MNEKAWNGLEAGDRLTTSTGKLFTVVCDVGNTSGKRKLELKREIDGHIFATDDHKTYGVEQPGQSEPESESLSAPSMSTATLRDYFAAHALTGLLSNELWWREGPTNAQQADAAYRLADAMIAYREVDR